MDLDALSEEEEEEEDEPPPKPARSGRAPASAHAGPDGIAEVPTRPRTRRGVPAAVAAGTSPAPLAKQPNQVRFNSPACHNPVLLLLLAVAAADTGPALYDLHATQNHQVSLALPRLSWSHLACCASPSQVDVSAESTIQFRMHLAEVL